MTKPPAPKPTPPVIKPAGSKPPTSSKPATAPRAAKTFSIVTYGDSKEGEKVILYGPSGGGKTSLAATTPNPVFFPIDDGARKIIHPVTGAELRAIRGVESLEDMRDALRQHNLFNEGDTAVIDTITKVQDDFGIPYTLKTVKKEKGGDAQNVEDYGYGKGYTHLLGSMRLLLPDFDNLIRKGVNVLLLAQTANSRVANAEGTDYIQEGPKLHQDSNVSIRSEFCAWADHVLRIGHGNFTVARANDKATKGKISGDSTRLIYTQPRLHFIAKNRCMPFGRVPEIVSFDSPSDDSIWQFVFKGATLAAE